MKTRKIQSATHRLTQSPAHTNTHIVFLVSFSMLSVELHVTCLKGGVEKVNNKKKRNGALDGDKVNKIQKQKKWMGIEEKEGIMHNMLRATLLNSKYSLHFS